MQVIAISCILAKSGRFNFNVFQELTDTKFTSNDLGYFTNNNYLNHGLWMGYRWVTPGSWYNRINMNVNFKFSHLYRAISKDQPVYQTSDYNINVNGQLKIFGGLAFFNLYAL